MPELTAGAYSSQSCNSTLTPVQLTFAVSSLSTSGACLLSSSIASVLAAVEWGSFEAMGLVVVGLEGTSPAPAESLVVVAVSSTGERPPIDSASFTTSWVICSAITIPGSVGAAREPLLGRVSSTGTERIREDTRQPRTLERPCITRCSKAEAKTKYIHLGQVLTVATGVESRFRGYVVFWFKEVARRRAEESCSGEAAARKRGSCRELEGTRSVGRWRERGLAFMAGWGDGGVVYEVATSGLGFR
jgi:hypothetical protein